jgi:hypothetical protein
MIGLIALALLAAPLSDDAKQAAILTQIGDVLAGRADPKTVARHFHKDAVFAGQREFAWDIIAFRDTLRARDCNTGRSLSYRADQVLIGLTEAERADARRLPSYGPGLSFHCVSAKRIAAHEIYTFRFEGDKVKRVFFARAMAVPGAPAARKDETGG